MGCGMRSDLARECGCEENGEGVRVSHTEACGHEILRVQIKSEAAAERLGKPCGRYVTVALGDAFFDERERESLCRVLGVELREMAERLAGKRTGEDFSLLVVGLGNAELTPDALGPKTVQNLTVTRGNDRVHDGLSLSLHACRISAIATGISAQTGLETVEILQGLVHTTAPDLILVIDSLAARSTAHLGATVQLSDTGIQPGSGIGGTRPALTRGSVGVPVMAVGVPTVVETSTLVGDALARFGIGQEMPEYGELLGGGAGFFVTPKDIDFLLPLLAALLADSIERAFTA